jgi:hypothetical protein
LWFRDICTPGRRRTVTALAEISLKLSKQTPSPILVLHIRQGDPIHPGGPTVYPDPFPRLPQDVTPVNTVIQDVETPLLRLLGRSP